MAENWMYIKIFNKEYMISDKGNVWSNKSDKMLKQFDNGYGYLRVSLTKNGKTKQYLVHRLVAETFLSKNSKDQCVNHIDENRKNNCLSNLEWCTYKHNANHGTKNIRMVKSRETSPKWLREQTIPVVAVNMKTGVRNYYKSMMEAERNGFHSGHISDCVRGINKSHKGYKWFKQSEYKGVS